MILIKISPGSNRTRTIIHAARGELEPLHQLDEEVPLQSQPIGHMDFASRLSVLHFPRTGAPVHVVGLGKLRPSVAEEDRPGDTVAGMKYSGQDTSSTVKDIFVGGMTLGVFVLLVDQLLCTGQAMLVYRWQRGRVSEGDELISFHM